MRLNYSSERREMVGALNRGKTLSTDTIEKIRSAALNRAPMSDETRAKVSKNSAKAQQYLVSRVDGNWFKDVQGNLQMWVIINTLAPVTTLTGSNEKTVRRAIKSDGIVKSEWIVTVVGKVNNHNNA